MYLDCSFETRWFYFKGILGNSVMKEKLRNRDVLGYEISTEFKKKKVWKLQENVNTVPSEMKLSVWQKRIK